MKKSFFNKNNPWKLFLFRKKTRAKKFKVRMFYHLKKFVRVVFVRGVFGLRGFCSGGFVGGYVQGFFVRGVFVLSPYFVIDFNLDFLPDKLHPDI